MIENTSGQISSSDRATHFEFIDRLKSERANLSGKLDALTLFLQRINKSGVSETHKELLLVQQHAMKLYLAVLDMRLNSLSKDVPNFAKPSRPLASVNELGELQEMGGHNEDRDGPVSFGG